MSSRLRLGILSTARINAAILAAAAAGDRVRVVAVASRSEARARRYAAENGVGSSHASYAALLADPGVDAVYVSLPNSLHVDWTIRALEAGKHVLCEKPFDPDPVAVERAFDVAGGAGLVLMEAFMYRHHPQTAALLRLVRSGAIGRLRLIRSFLGFRLDDPSDVRMQPELGGGAFLDAGCYTVSVARLLAGEPEAVAGEQVLGETGVDVAFAATLRFPDGVLAQVGASYLVPLRRELEVLGSEGSLRSRDPFRPNRDGALVLERDGEEVERVEPAADDPYRLQLENFADAVVGRDEPVVGREETIAQARTLEALYRSAREGTAIGLAAA
jgi:D-xylose 1-dehydrogenase (NADP+, D-xylono-1,5-lactone-forming)